MTGHKDSFQVQRLEVVNTGRRRRWSLDEKLRIVEDSFQGHRQVSATARRHDISPSLLFSWRKAFQENRFVSDTRSGPSVGARSAREDIASEKINYLNFVFKFQIL